MNCILKYFTGIVTFVFIMQSSVAQQVLPIYQDSIPYNIGVNSSKEKTTVTDIIRISNVSIPTLSVYQPDQPNGTAILIFPGGGYEILAWDHEGTKVAEWLTKNGITAIVVKYRLPNASLMTNSSFVPLTDALNAISTVRQNATLWKIDTNKVGILGFSAGGHLAASAANHFIDFEQGKFAVKGKPNFSILVYPVMYSNQQGHAGSMKNLLGTQPSEKLLTYFNNIQQVHDHTPSSLLFHSYNDEAVPVINSIDYFLALKKKNIPASLHIYPDGGHGFGMNQLPIPNMFSNWTNTVINWLKQGNFL